MGSLGNASSWRAGRPGPEEPAAGVLGLGRGGPLLMRARQPAPGWRRVAGRESLRRAWPGAGAGGGREAGCRGQQAVRVVSHALVSWRAAEAVCALRALWPPQAETGGRGPAP